MVGAGGVQAAALFLDDLLRGLGEESLILKFLLQAVDFLVRLGHGFLQAGLFGGDVDDALERQVDLAIRRASASPSPRARRPR